MLPKNPTIPRVPLHDGKSRAEKFKFDVNLGSKNEQIWQAAALESTVAGTTLRLFNRIIIMNSILNQIMRDLLIFAVESLNKTEQ